MGGEAEGKGRRPRRLVLLGAPGSGKGTQACFLAESLGVPAISTGEMLRNAVDEGTALGKRVEGVMAAGRLVEDDLMADVVRDRLARPDAAAGFLLDGYPRTAGQAATLERILAESGLKLDRTVLLEVPEEVLIGRALGRGRADDREEVIRERLRIYLEKTAPLVDYYRRQGLLTEVDGNREIEVVTAAVLKELGAE